MAKNKGPFKLGETLKKITKEFILNEAKKERDKAYDIRRIFEEMELNLISSMKKALYFHQNEQAKEGFQWEQWQLTKLREIEKYRRKNKSLIEAYNKPIQEAINRELQGNYLKGQNRIIKFIDKIKRLVSSKKQPSIILPSDISEGQGIKDYISKLLNIPVKPPKEENFFGVNDKKLDALQKTVNNDLNKANQAVLIKMDDVYKQVLYKAQVNMQAGAKTLNQAIDMATKEFLEKGINCIEYKNGARVNIASYAEMALRTASHRATLLGEGKKRDEWGLHLIVVSAHANTCKHCEPWQGKVLIDDVFSHPSKEYLEENKQYPLLSEAIEKKLLHPNCRHTLTTYFPGITKLPVVPNGKEAIKTYEAEQKQRALERELRKWKRVQAGSCDLENEKKAAEKVKELQDNLKKHLDDNPQLRRDYEREKPGQGISNKDVKTHEANIIRDSYKEIQGVITSNGTTIDYISDHFIDRSIERKVTAKEIKDALTNPLNVGKIKYNKDNKPSIEYIGEFARVQVNPEIGKLATVWRTSSKLRNKYVGDKNGKD